MIYTVLLDDNYVDARNLLEEMSHCKQGVRFENPFNHDVTPAEYLTVEQFRIEAKQSLTKIMNEHGIH
jgi:hypothetical protein